MIYASIMIITSMYGFIDFFINGSGIADNALYGVMELVSGLLGLETIAIYWCFPTWVFTNDIIGERQTERDAR